MICIVPVQTEIAFLCLPPLFQILFPAQRTHVLVQNQGQDLQQSLRDKQLLWSSYLVHILPSLAHSLSREASPACSPICLLATEDLIGNSSVRTLLEIPCYLTCRRLLHRLTFQTLPTLVENDFVFLGHKCSIGRRGWDGEGGGRRRAEVCWEMHQMKRKEK